MAEAIIVLFPFDLVLRRTLGIERLPFPYGTRTKEQ